ncbi:interleukin-15 receptor subunit alpha [Strix aluco]|uniref:interleukin-15 receptor subunit alpha n=1 Tax=Strix aluco TaxID=111821 RepID=UPI003DA61989
MNPPIPRYYTPPGNAPPLQTPGIASPLDISPPPRYCTPQVLHPPGHCTPPRVPNPSPGHCTPPGSPSRQDLPVTRGNKRKRKRKRFEPRRAWPVAAAGGGGAEPRSLRGSPEPPARPRGRRRPMAGPLLPLLCGTVALLMPWVAADTAPVRCSRPKDVANAHIDVDDNVLLNTRLRYTCNPGYKRKAGTSSLIQCVLPEGSSEPDWTQTTLKCIRDPALPPQTPSPELPTTLHTERTERESTDTNPTSSPSPAAAPGLPGAASQSPVPPAPDGPPPELSMPPETPPALETPTPGEGTAQGTSLGTTPLPPTPMDHAAVSTQILAPSIGLSVLVVAGIVAYCCWRMKMRVRPDYAAVAIPMVARAAENEEMSRPGVLPTG